jgi:hypothetical protein
MSDFPTYEWYIDLSPSRQATYIHYSHGVITPENELVWKKYLDRIVENALSRKTMETPEFKAVEEEVRQEAEQAERFRIHQERQREIKMAMKVPAICFIPKGMNVDYEAEYSTYLQQEVTFEPRDRDEFNRMIFLIERWCRKSVPQILAKNRPDAAYAIAITVCRHLPKLLERKDLNEYSINSAPRIRKMIRNAFLALHDTTIAWKNEAKRQYINDFITKQADTYASMARGMAKYLLDLRIDKPFIGEPTGIIREKNDEELRREREIEWKKQLAEKQRLEDEQEANSIIPLNPDYERTVFDSNYIDGEFLDLKISLEVDHIMALLSHRRDHAEAALLTMQLIKSLCRHYIMDEHYCYFDDVYVPDYTIGDLIKKLNEMYKNNELSPDVISYLHQAWQEILQTECKSSYGVPSCDLIM